MLRVPTRISPTLFVKPTSNAGIPLIHYPNGRRKATKEFHETMRISEMRHFVPRRGSGSPATRKRWIG